MTNAEIKAELKKDWDNIVVFVGNKEVCSGFTCGEDIEVSNLIVNMLLQDMELLRLFVAAISVVKEQMEVK
jgi:hypothetical protein